MAWRETEEVSRLLPELVVGGNPKKARSWRVIDDPVDRAMRSVLGYSNAVDGIINVDPTLETVKIHELAHAKWSPLKPVAVRDHALAALYQGCEDARVQTLAVRYLTGADLEHPCCRDVAEVVRQLCERKDWVGACHVVCNAYRTDMFDAVYETLYGANYGLADVVHDVLRNVIRRDLLNPRVSLKAARKIRKAVEDTLTRDVERKREKERAERAATMLADPSALERASMRAGDSLDSLAHTLKGAGMVESGKLRVVYDHMAQWVRAALLGRSRVYSDEGSIMRAPHRYAIDRAVFGVRRRRVSGGTVVIDCSGSMHLGPDGVAALLAEAPGATVAIYAGADGNTRGELHVLAKDGRRVSDVGMPWNSGGNVVDLPVLLWLARQAHPRVWVCDGDVTGGGDTRSAAITNACAAVVRAARVTRVDTCERAVELLHRMRRR